MIDGLVLKAFKSYPDVTIPFKPLTLFSGLNSTGKSSIIQALRMFNRAVEGKSPLLPGHGSVSDMRSRFVAPKEQIEISCLVKPKLEASSKQSLLLSDSSVVIPKSSLAHFYVAADRLGPQTVLPLSRSFGELPNLGDHCEYVLDVLEQFRHGLIPDPLRHPDAQGSTLEFVLSAWLSEISPGVKFDFSTDQKSDSARAEIDSFRPANVGFGLSYTLPVIVAVLAMSALPPSEDSWGQEWGELWDTKRAKEGGMVIIENPEAHLHPQGQTAMGRMLALASSCGVQIVVETHSDHLMDGIRLATKEQLVSADQIAFHFLSKTEEGLTEITTPTLHQNGKLDSWPAGFFDQTLKNRAMLARRD